MRIVKRNSAQGGFNITRKGGAIMRMMSNPTEGLGKAQTPEFYEQSNVSKPFKTLDPSKIASLDGVKVKGLGKQKKYISLKI